MCRLKSGIVLKDGVYLAGDTDSHSKMLDQLGIEDTDKNARRLFVRAELRPNGGDVFSDPATWEWEVDQDILPEWYVEEYEKERFRTAVIEWQKTHVFVGVDGLQLKGHELYFLKDCTHVEAYGSAGVMAYGSASVEAHGYTRVEAYDSASVDAHDRAGVMAYGSASVEAYDSARVKAYDSAGVEAHGSARVEAYGSARVEAYGSASIMIPGGGAL